MLEEIVQTVLKEYGVFVAFLVITNAILLYVINKLWKQNVRLGEKLLQVIEHNTEVLTTIRTKLEEH